MEDLSRRNGDLAVEKLTEEFEKIIISKRSFLEGITKIDETLQKAAWSWNLKGDDRVLSMMRIQAGTAAEDIAKYEISKIAGSSESYEQKKEKLENLRRKINNIPWLAKGFKSSIGLDISFSIAQLLHN